MNEMWDQMSPELRLENQEIFIAYHDRVAKEEIDLDVLESSSGHSCAGPAQPADILSPYLRRCFDDALLSKSPSDVYVAVPTLLTRCRNGFLTCLPYGLRQYIVQRKYKHNIANLLKV